MEKRLWCNMEHNCGLRLDRRALTIFNYAQTGHIITELCRAAKYVFARHFLPYLRLFQLGCIAETLGHSLR